MRSETFYTAGDYEFNICGPIRNSSHCTGDNVSVCLVKMDNGGKRKGFPLTNSTGYQLDFVGVDSVRLSYIGENIGGRTTRVEIELVCSLATTKDLDARGPIGGNYVHRINFYSSRVCPRYRNDPVSIGVFEHHSLLNFKTALLYTKINDPRTHVF